MLSALRQRFMFMNVNLRILTVRQVLGMFCRRMVLSYKSLYILAVGGDEAQIGFVNSLQPLAGLLMFPISGYLTDRVGRKKLIALAGYLFALTGLLYVFAPTWEWIAIAALLQGFIVFQFPPLSALLADSLEPRIRGVGVASMSTLANAFAIFSPYIAGLTLEFYGIDLGMRFLYALLALTGFINATLALLYLKETTVTAKAVNKVNIVAVLKEAYSGIPELIHNLPKSIQALGVIVGMGFITNGLASPFWVVFVTEEIGLSNIDWGLILLCEAVVRTSLTIPCGLMSDRYGRAKTLLAAVVCSFVTLPSLILATNFYHVLLIRIGIGLSGALFIPSSTALMSDYIPRVKRGRVMAAIGRGSFMVGATGGGVGGPGMGYIFTIPAMVASVMGGLVYSLSPLYLWLCVFGTTLIQLVSVILFVRDPEQAER